MTGIDLRGLMVAEIPVRVVSVRRGRVVLEVGGQTVVGRRGDTLTIGGSIAVQPDNERRCGD